MNKCLECGKETDNPKFCSRSCSASYNNRKYPKRGNGKPRYCKNCGKELSKESGHRKIYCNQTCFQEYKRNQKIEKWLSGQWSGTIANKRLSSIIRNYLLDKVGHKCEKCGWNEPNPITGEPILTVSHIDGNPENNRPENLEVLCFNCHTLTPSFGSLNNGNGRQSRGLKRYDIYDK
jgi:hypothetical protein